MSAKYNAGGFIIANTEEKLNSTISFLKKQDILEYVSMKSCSGKQEGTTWYFTKFSKDCDGLPDESTSINWKSLLNQCAAQLEKDGAIIVQFTNNWDIERGGEGMESEHIATTPKGRVLHYDTDYSLDFADDDDLDYLEIPHGYDKFKNAFIRAYSSPGREMFKIYEKGHI